MSIFCFKKLTEAKRLGSKLREKRESAGLDLDTLALATHINTKYLMAIERGAYRELPSATAHRTAYIKEYAKAIGWDPGECLAAFKNEAGYAGVEKAHPKTAIRYFPFASISIAVRNFLLAGAVALFAGYLVWQVRGILEPPRLAIFAPIEGEINTQPLTTVQGQTDPETSLTINGQEIMVNDKGNFETKMDLTAGVNTITVEAKKKHGKTTTITRHVVVRQPAQVVSVK